MGGKPPTCGPDAQPDPADRDYAWPRRARVVVLVSGRGSNLQSLIDARCPIALALSNVPDTPALRRARAAEIPTHVIDHRAFPSRAAFDAALAKRIDRPERADLVVLAGFMRVLGGDFTDRFAGRMINVHPSLLPAFPGLRTHERALAAGAATHGGTIHFVTRELDAGPVIARARVPVRPNDSAASLAARVLEREHRILTRAVHWFVTGRLRLHDGEARLDGRRIGDE